jgi:hypothetical protein
MLYLLNGDNSLFGLLTLTVLIVVAAVTTMNTVIVSGPSDTGEDGTSGNADV